MIFQSELITLNVNGNDVEVLASPVMLQSSNPLADIKAGIFNKMYLYSNWMSEDYLFKLYGGMTIDYLGKHNAMLYGKDVADFYLGYLNIDNETKTFSLPADINENTELLQIAGEALFSADRVFRMVAVMNATNPDDINVKRL